MSEVTASRSASIPQTPMIFNGVCIESDDPIRAGRIIAVDDVKVSASEGQLPDPVRQALTRRKKQIEAGEFVAWSVSPENADPDVHNPLLPLHLNQIPKSNEAIKLLYYDPSNRRQNKQYLGPITSSPHLLEGENYETGRYHNTVAIPQEPLGPAVTENVDSRGVFPNPKDIAIQGRYNTDIILGMEERMPTNKEDSATKLASYIAPGVPNMPELENHPQILIRSGKFIKKKETPTQPIANKKMTFIQLNTFPKTLQIKEEPGGKNIKFEDEKVHVIFGYDISSGVDPLAFTDNSNPDIEFTMALSMLPNTTKEGQTQVYMASEVDLETNFVFTQDILVANFTLSKNEAADEINKILSSFDQYNFVDVLKPISGTTGTNNPHYGFSPVNKAALERKLNVSGLKGHPLYFRPGPFLVEFLLKNDPNAPEFSSYGSINAGNFDTIRESIKEFTEKITLEGVKSKGYGLAFSSKPDKRTIPSTSEDIVNKIPVFEDRQSGYVTVGSENIYLLSHNSSELGHIQLENNYGISQLKYIDDIDKKTNSLVRGEKLLELLELVVEFTTSHTHNPGEAPIPKSWGGTTTQDIIDKMQKAHDEVLNKNIRIN